MGRWLERLRALDAAALGSGLSDAGAREALDAALNALSDEALADAAALPLAPWPTASVIPASTVFTAPLEWCAVLLGRGSRVVVKRPRARSGLVDAMVAAAGDLPPSAAGALPLSATDARADAADADLVVVMGSDATVEAVGHELRPGARLAAHGHAWSLAWIAERWDALAVDLALHDGRGCLSPAVVLTPRPLPEAVDALGAAMARAQERLPVGEIAAAEGAAIRQRRAMARVLGAVAEGDGWSVHGLPPERAIPASAPRSALVVSVPDLAAALSWARRWPGLSTVGTDDPGAIASWRAVASSRVCAAGEMQRPPLRRLHDGVDWVAEETGRPLDTR